MDLSLIEQPSGPAAESMIAEALAALWARLESPHSRRAYAGDWRRWVAWLSAQGVHAHLARAHHVAAYLAAMAAAGSSRPTRSRALGVLRGTYGALVVAFSRRPGVLEHNPAREVKTPTQSSEPRTPWLSADELRAMLAVRADGMWAARRDWLVMATLVGTGLRRSEVARLDRAQMMPAPDGSRLAVRVRAKGHKEAIIILPSWLSAELVRWRRLPGPMFPRGMDSSLPISPSKVASIIKAAAMAAGVDTARATPHAIRRSFITLTGERGASLRDRQGAVLHSSASTTELYDHATRAGHTPPGELLEDLAYPERAKKP